MMLLSFIAAMAAAESQCTQIGRADIVAVPAPAVIVLGERHGTQPDLARAERIVRLLAMENEVTLALESVGDVHQGTLDDFADGKLSLDALPQALEWDQSSAFPWTAYQSLVTGALYDVDVIAAGPPTDAPPNTKRFPVPSGYASLYVDAMGNDEVEKGIEERFVRAMAWRENRIAHFSTQSWDRKGYLVIVTDRAGVEGGLGVTWQLRQMLQGVPVHGYTLHWGSNPPCYSGDKLWRQPWWDKLFESWGWKE